MTETVTVEGSNNLFYQPIPFDMLYTASEEPAIQVKVNGVYASCPDYNCHYKVNADIVPTHTSTSLSGNVLTLTYSKPTALTKEIKLEDISVRVQTTKCEMATLDADPADQTETYKITCTLPVNEDGTVAIMAGTAIQPEIHFDDIGYALLPSSRILRRSLVSVTTLDVAMAVTTITNGDALTKCGNVEITLAGTGFPF